jgi:hypothetical protein
LSEYNPAQKKGALPGDNLTERQYPVDQLKALGLYGIGPPGVKLFLSALP